MHGVQEYQLFHPPQQERSAGEKTGIKKILPPLPQAHLA